MARIQTTHRQSGDLFSATMYNEIIDSVNALYDRQESFNGAYSSATDLSGKEDKVAIATALPATLEAGKYYRLGTVSTLSAALPTVSDTSHAASIMIGLTASADITPQLTASASVYYQEGFEIKSGGTYEINCLWNGSYWSVTEIKFETA